MVDEKRSWLNMRDVIVLILVVNLLIVLGLPAIQYAQEAARKHQCADKMRALSVALHAYHDEFDSFPPAAYWSDEHFVFDETYPPGTSRDLESYKSIYLNWVTLVLPFLDEQELAGQFHPAQPIVSSAHEHPRNVELALMKCPSDDFNRADNHFDLVFDDGTQATFARGNYAINGGSNSTQGYPGYLTHPVPNGFHFDIDYKTREFSVYGSGIAGFNKCFRVEDFLNGQSSLVAVDEIRSGIHVHDPRGCWALGQIGASVTWAHGVNGDDYAPNAKHRDSDDILHGTALHQEISADSALREGVPFCDHCNQSNQITARSKHDGGVNCLFVDGSVRFVSNDIEPSLWQIIHSRETPPGIVPADFVKHLAGFDGYRDAVRTFDDRPLLNRQTESEPEFTNSIGMSLTLISPGEFTMAVPDRDNHYPFPDVAIPHQVKLSRFFSMGQCEVTTEQFAIVMGGASALEGSERHIPVVNVTWYQAVEFCRALSERPEEKSAGRIYRLPTEAEWEYCSRAGQSEPFPFSGKWDPDDDSGIIGGKDWTPDQRLLPVRSYRANPFGLYDMCGNAFEWVNDWFQRDYYSRSPIADPQGPSHGYLKVVRGWYWRFLAEQCKRDYLVTAPWRKSEFVGFRVVCEKIPGTAP